MSQLVDAMRQKDTLTENGAVTHSTSLSAVLDLFFIAGACRNKTDQEIENYLVKAFDENPELAVKIGFWAGDIRGGAGERRFFRVFLNFLRENHSDTFYKNLDNVPHYNRWDSLFQFPLDKSVLSYVQGALETGNALLAKWMPREGKSNYQDFRKAFLVNSGYSRKKYRKVLVEQTKVVEQQMSAKQFGKIQYKSVPSVAFNKYKNAFRRNDEERFSKFLEKVEKGEAKINAGAIFPHDIYRSMCQGGDQKAGSLQWDNLPNYLEGSNERILPVCDVSGSMAGLPMDISVSLGIYLSERNEGIFKDAFMTFSESPEMQYLKGSLAQRMHQLRRAAWGYNTDLQKTFEVLLHKAVSNGISADQMPTTMLIISDMEFDQATSGKTNLEEIRDRYENSGYKMPNIVFWNVDSRNDNSPISYNDTGVALVSGASPSVIKTVLGGDVSPMKVLKDTVLVERYDKVVL